MKKRWERYSDQEHATMKRMWSEGASLNAIAHALGRNLRSVCSRIHENRQDFPMRRVRTTREERREMAELRKTGMTYAEIGEYMGVCEATARRYAYDGKRQERER